MDEKSTPATRQDIDALREEILAGEVRLMKAFYALAEANQQRAGQAEVNLSSLNARLASLEARLTEVEKWLNISSERTQ